MSIFPNIQKLDDLLPFIKDNSQIRVKQEDNGMYVVCYMLQDEDTFSGAAEEYARECRGITFDPNGLIAGRTMHKFFNVGERAAAQPFALPWANVARIMEKRDGSMVTPIRTPDDGLKFKTKKTFGSKEAELAGQVMVTTNGGLVWVDGILGAGLTPTFEITSPKFPIVVRYERDELTLLQIRENVTGRYLAEDEIFALNPPFPVVKNLLDSFSVIAAGVDGTQSRAASWDLLKQQQEVAEGLEGWVIQFETGEMVKLKTKWYQELHHHVVFSRWRDVARTVLADQADDLKGHFALVGRSIEPIIRVERRIKHVIEAAESAVNDAVAYGQRLGYDAKTMALTFKEHQLFGQIMSRFRGKDVDWSSWYEKNRLNVDFSLEVIPDQPQED